MECRIEANKAACNCTYPCGSKGICCECLHKHRLNGQLPACFFPADAETTYDRSIDHFIRLAQERGRWWAKAS